MSSCRDPGIEANSSAGDSRSAAIGVVHLRGTARQYPDSPGLDSRADPQRGGDAALSIDQGAVAVEGQGVEIGQLHVLLQGR